MDLKFIIMFKGFIEKIALMLWWSVQNYSPFSEKKYPFSRLYILCFCYYNILKMMGIIRNILPLCSAVHVSVICNYNLGENLHTILQLRTTPQYIIHVDKLLNSFPMLTQQPIGDNILVHILKTVQINIRKIYPLLISTFSNK